MRTRSVVLVVLLTSLVAAAPANAVVGSAGLGDRLFPTLGNGGYDVQSYDLGLRYNVAPDAQSFDGTATIVARATQALTRFDLDFTGGGPTAVSIDGKAAKFARSGGELIITPAVA